jgi:hypothetical protein
MSITNIDEDFDFGFSTIDREDFVSSAEVDARINKILNLIDPLLDNLMKNPDKDIHWPDRDKKIKEFKKKLYETAFGGNSDE